jgi:hypothetical protein
MERIHGAQVGGLAIIPRLKPTDEDTRGEGRHDCRKGDAWTGKKGDPSEQAPPRTDHGITPSFQVPDARPDPLFQTGIGLHPGLPVTQERGKGLIGFHGGMMSRFGGRRQVFLFPPPPCRFIAYLQQLDLQQSPHFPSEHLVQELQESLQHLAQTPSDAEAVARPIPAMMASIAPALISVFMMCCPFRLKEGDSFPLHKVFARGGGKSPRKSYLLASNDREICNQ